LKPRRRAILTNQYWTGTILGDQRQHTLMSSRESIIDERDLARTYDGRAYSDPYEAVQEYRKG